MTETNIREVLSRLNIEGGEVNASGWVVCRCPFAEFLHQSGQDSRPSFFVHIEPSGVSGINCFTCKTTGTVAGLVRKLMHYRQEDYTELVIDAECWDTADGWGDYEEGRGFVMAEPIEDGDLILDSYPDAWDIARAREYLASRNISQDTARVLRLKYDPEARRIAFPIIDERQDFYGMTGRSVIPDARVKVKDYFGVKKDQLILGSHLMEGMEAPEGLVVEGLFALAHAVEIGCLDLGVVPVATMGSHMSEFQADRISSLFKTVHMLYDDDLAGDIGMYGRQDEQGEHKGAGAIDLLRELGVAVNVPLYPAHTGDPDDLITSELSAMVKR